jgi:alpha-beta hydrolase superfamily lysophospholipase
MKIIVAILLVIVIIFISRWSWSYIENKMLYQPSKDYMQMPDDFDIEFEDIKVDELSAWFCPVKESEKLIIYCHGNGGNIGNTLGFVEIMNKKGYNVLVFDYSGYGKSNGIPSESILVENVYQILDYATQVKEFKTENIILYGHSLGGAVAIQAAAGYIDGPELGGLVVEGTFYSLIDRAKDSFKCLGWPCFSIDTKYRSYDYIKYIRCPFIIVHSTRDEIIQYNHAEKLLEAAQKQKKNVKLITIKGLHNAPIYTNEFFTEISDLFMADE